MSKDEHYYLIVPLTATGRDMDGFTYHSDEVIVPGSIVEIPLGRRSLVGIAIAAVGKPEFTTRPITSVLPYQPVPAHLRDIAEWVARYYAAARSLVWRMMLPAGLTKTRRTPKGLDPALRPQDPPPPLTDAQVSALKVLEIPGRNYLIQGVTGSGKTRLYQELCRTTLEAGKSAIVLIPEIALAPQAAERFEAWFPGAVSVSHSGLTEAQRHRLWERVLDTPRPQVVIGPRSALFLPVAELGLIIIDESHEASYKQEQTPRYDAVSTAAQLARITGAKLVLGSATPALWQTELVNQGRLHLVELTERFHKGAMPPATIIDMRNKANFNRSKLLAEPLVNAIVNNLQQGRQSLLFLNRRGTAAALQCSACGWVSICPNCSLPLTFHADAMALRCHICNHTEPPPAICPDCKADELYYRGIGTKRLESEVAKLFPGARLARLDRDSATQTHLTDTYAGLHAGDIDILIGTQMIAKGLDLPDLDTVGIINADTMLHLPDYTAAERTFQLVTQAAGRAGRQGQLSQVFIQTYSPLHPAILAAAQHDFGRFAEAELAERRLLAYPPYVFLLKLWYSAAREETAHAAAISLAAQLKLRTDILISGPAPGFRPRRANQYVFQLVIKANGRKPLVEIAAALPNGWQADLDPNSLL
jgi:primosomal protein N' (replication factor Y)